MGLTSVTAIAHQDGKTDAGPALTCRQDLSSKGRRAMQTPAIHQQTDQSLIGMTT